MGYATRVRPPASPGEPIPRSTLLLAGAIGVLTGVALLLPIDRPDRALAVLAALAPLLLLSDAAQRDRLRGRIDLLNLGVAGALALLAYFGVRGLIVSFTDDPLTAPVVAQASEAARSEAMLAVILGSYAAWIGYVLAAELLRNRTPLAWPTVSRRTCVVLGIAVIVVGAPALVIQSIASQAALSGNENGLGSISGVVNVLAVLPFYGVALFGMSLGESRREWILWSVAAAALLLLGVVSLFKETIVLTILCCAVPLHYRRHVLGWQSALAIAAVFCLLVVPGIQTLRIERAAGDSTSEALKDLPGRLATFDLTTGAFERNPAPLAPWRYVLQAASLSSRRLAGTDSVVAVTRLTPRPNSFEYGSTVWPLLTGPIPRVVWPDKPRTGLGRSFTENYWARGTGNTSAQPITVIGEGYANLGLLGVVALLAIVGAAWRFAQYLVPPRAGLAVVAYPFILAAVLAVERNVAYTAVNLGQRLAPLVVLVPAAIWLDRRFPTRA